MYPEHLADCAQPFCKPKQLWKEEPPKFRQLKGCPFAAQGLRNCLGSQSLHLGSLSYLESCSSSGRMGHCSLDHMCPSCARSTGSARLPSLRRSCAVGTPAGCGLAEGSWVRVQGWFLCESHCFTEFVRLLGVCRCDLTAEEEEEYCVLLSSFFASLCWVGSLTPCRKAHCSLAALQP